MTDAFYFGELQRPLFGVLHRAATPSQGSLLMCAPLLQDGIRSHRMLRAIAEGLAEAGAHALRFDWYGAGDSGGDTAEQSVPGLLLDLGEAAALLDTLSNIGRSSWLALRSAAIPLLMHASGRSEPVDLILWDPCLNGQRLIDDWREQHRKQMTEAGRYPGGHADPQADELLGFEVDSEMLAALAAFEGGAVTLPAGSRVLLAVWEVRPDQNRFVEALRRAGIFVECRTFDFDDRPSFTDPDRFETQAYPRRSAGQMVQWLTNGDRT